MTMTETGPAGATGTPWPTRREREGGPVRTRAVARRPAPQPSLPRHAAVEPDPTVRLPVFVPAQRTAPAPRSAPAPLPVPEPRADRPVPSTIAREGAAVGPRRAAPCPPRPAVGSAVHDVAALPRRRPARNGLGVAAAVLGGLGLPCGLFPVTGFAAAVLGLVGLVLGVAGRARARAGTATNRGTAVTGAVLGLVALGLGVIGAVAFLHAPDRLAYDLDALTAGLPSVSAIGE